MRSRTISAVAGLGLALLLAAVGVNTSAASGASDADADAVAVGDPESGGVVAASAGDTPPVTMPLGVTSTHDFAASPYANAPRQVWVPVPVVPEPQPEPTPAPQPQPEAAPAPPPPAPAGSIDDILNRHFGAGAGRAKAIAQCESGLNPNAVSPTNDHGLFQINIVHKDQFRSVTGAPWSSVYDAELNTIYAKWLHGQEGWGPWACNRKV